MQDAQFSSPVFVSVGTAAPGRCLVEVGSVRQALIALDRHGVGGFRIDDPLWQVTSDRLARAMQDPTVKTVEESREAFRCLALAFA